MCVLRGDFVQVGDWFSTKLVGRGNASGYCVAARTAAAGSAVYAVVCEDSHPLQQWRLDVYSQGLLQLGKGQFLLCLVAQNKMRETSKGIFARDLELARCSSGGDGELSSWKQVGARPPPPPPSPPPPPPVIGEPLGYLLATVVPFAFIPFAASVLSLDRPVTLIISALVLTALDMAVLDAVIRALDMPALFDALAYPSPFWLLALPVIYFSCQFFSTRRVSSERLAMIEGVRHIVGSWAYSGPYSGPYSDYMHHLGWVYSSTVDYMGQLYAHSAYSDHYMRSLYAIPL